MPRGRRLLVLVFGAALCGVDLWVFTGARAHSPARLGFGLLACFGLWLLCGRRGACLGLRAQPLPSLRYWLRILLWLGLGSIVLAAGVGTWMALGDGLPASQYRAGSLWFHFSRSVLLAPISEELIYRVLLCGGLLPLCGVWATTLVATLVFAWLHVCYGNFAPNHVIAGVILSLAYLRSGCIWLPMALHALGNLLVFLLQLGLLLWH